MECADSVRLGPCLQTLCAAQTLLRAAVLVVRAVLQAAGVGRGAALWAGESPTAGLIRRQHTASVCFKVQEEVAVHQQSNISKAEAGRQQAGTSCQPACCPRDMCQNIGAALLRLGSLTDLFNGLLS